MRNNWLYVFMTLLMMVDASAPVWARKHRVVIPSAYDQPSVVVNEDSTVSFCFCGAAKHVSVQTDMQFVGEDSSRYNKWYDREENINRRVNIYLPAAYVQMVNGKCPNGTFPVLYLLHGINGYEGSWTERGRTIQIIENLIACDSIEPLIVVMPDCNTGSHEDRPSHHTLWNNVWHYPRLCCDHSLELAMEDLMLHVDTAYHVSDYSYIAGFSSGARIAANIVNRYPNKFQAVGLFSPVVYKEQMPRTNIPPFYIYMGKDDMFINNGRRFHKRLTKSGVDHFYMENEGGHTWRNWRIYLADFLKQIF